MAAIAPSSISIPQNKFKPINDKTCKVLCPECYVVTTAMGLVDDGMRYGCPMCGLVFSLEWSNY